MDYRLLENRKEAFIRWYAWSLEYKDCDPAVWLTNYINRRFDHNDEQKLWFCWLYGNTYNLPSAWVMMNEFPDFELATVGRIAKWEKDNIKRLRYQRDVTWNSKGNFPDMFESYKRFIGNGSQRERIDSFSGVTPKKTFDNLWSTINKDLHKFGRYSTWFYLQHLKHTANVDIEPSSLMLENHVGSMSHRNGLLLVQGKDHLVYKRKSIKNTPSELISLNEFADEIMEETKTRFPNLANDVDYFTLETALCSFKKLFREKNSRYLGYYLDRQSEEIVKCASDNWDGIEWGVMWQARKEMLDNRLIYNDPRAVDKFRFGDFYNDGYIKNLEFMFDDITVPSIGLEVFT